MSHATAFIGLRSIAYLADERSWQVKVSFGSRVFDGVIKDPFAQEDEEKLQYYFTDYYRVDPFNATAASAAADSLLRYARELYNQLEQVLEDSDLDLGLAPCTLQISAPQEDVSIHRLHWEAIEHLVLGAEIAVGRACTSASISTPVNTDLDKDRQAFNLLFLTSRRVGLDQVDVEYRPVLNSFLEVVARLPIGSGINFDVVRPGTYDALESCLKVKGPGFYDLVHFDIHGRTGPTIDAELLLSSAKDLADLEPVTAMRLGSLLKYYRVPTVFLNACDSARADTSLEANLAAGLIKAGLDNVIGMSYNLNVSAAQVFVREFYESFLVERLHIATATVRGRRALQEMKLRQARFKLEVEINDWIIPVFYRALEGPVFDSVPLAPPSKNRPNDSTVSLVSIRDQPCQENTLLGRDSDLLRLEMCLVKNRAVELSGQPGVGSSSLLGLAVPWWKSTKLVKSFQRFDMARPDFIGDDEDVTVWMLTLEITMLNASNTLLIFDHIDNMYDDLNNEECEVIEDFLSTLSRAVSHSRNNYLVIVTSKAPGSHEGYTPFTLDPLPQHHAVEMAFSLSPKLRSKSLADRENHYLLARFLDSLLGNCLAIAIFAQYLERLPSFSIKDFVISAWTSNLHKTHPALLKKICQSSFGAVVSRFADESIQESCGPVLMLAFCRERVSRQWIEFWEDDDNPVLINGDNPNLQKQPQSSFYKNLKHNMEILESFSLIKEDLNSTYWTLHPLLPYVFEAIVVRGNWKKTRNLFKGFYGKRSSEWSNVATEGRRRIYWDSTQVEADLKLELMNFVIDAWSSIQDSTDALDRDMPQHLLLSLSSFHPVGTSTNLNTLATIAALLEDAVRSFTNPNLYKRAKLLPQQLLGTWRQSKVAFQSLHEEGKCSCCSLLDVLVYLAWLSEYYRLYSTNSAASLTTSGKIIDLITRFEKNFKDIAHRDYATAVITINNAKAQLALDYTTQGRFNEARDMTRGISLKKLEDSLLDEWNKIISAYINAIIRYTELRVTPGASMEDSEKAEAEADVSAEDLGDLITRFATIYGIEPMRISAMFSQAALRIQRDPTQLLELDPVLASTLAMSTYRRGDQARLLQTRESQMAARLGWLTALESFLDIASLEGQAAFHVNLALGSAQTGVDFGNSLSHWEQAIEIFDADTYLASNKGSGWVRIEAAHAAQMLGNRERAYSYLREVYDMATLSGDGTPNLVVMLAITINNLYALAKDMPEVESRFPGLELDIQCVAIAYTGGLWNSSIYKRIQSVDPQSTAALQSFYKDQRNGSFMWDLRLEMRQNADESLDQTADRAVVIIRKVSQIIGCKFRYLDRFISRHFFPAFSKAIAKDLEGQQAGPNLPEVGFADVKETRRVCEEAERVIFAPEEERKDFVWIDKKFEKKGLRTW